MADPPLPAPPLAPPSGPLLLSGGGTVGVQTETMALAAVRLDALEEVLRGLAHRSRVVPRTTGAPGVLTEQSLDPGVDDRVDDAAQRVAGLARAAAERADTLRRALRSAATGYAEAEASARAGMEMASASLARSLGETSGIVVGAAVGALFGAAIGAWLAWALTPGTDEEKSARLGVWMRKHPRLVTTPEFVAVVRCIAGSVDDAVLGARHVPGLPSGDGVEVGGDAVLAAGAAAGLFRESDIRIRRVAEGTTVPPTTITDRFRRIPEGDQVRIEKYTAPGQPTRWIVYADPTETFTPTATQEPWDLTSNVDGVAGHASASFRATEAAMRDAGIAADEPVAFVGFSAGGLVAGMLAGSGHWNTQGLESFAGPIGNIPLPDGLPGMTVRHTDDFVPALAGPDLPSDRLLVEQRAFRGELPTSQVAPSHQRDSYERTAIAIDSSSVPQVRAQLEAMRAFAADQAARPGAVSEQSLYHADRTGEWRRAVDEPRVPRAYSSAVG